MGRKRYVMLLRLFNQSQFGLEFNNKHQFLKKLSAYKIQILFLW